MHLKNSLMDKILTKRILTQLSDYFLLDAEMTKPELRCLKDMVIGILKSRFVLVNQIGTIPVKYTVKGKTHALWLVVSKNKRHGDSVICSLKVNFPQQWK